MPRRPRLRVAGIPQHLIQRGNNRSACFFAERDYRYYLYQIAKIAQQRGVAVHAYVLMTNNVHLLVTPDSPQSISDLMKHLGQRYVQYVNRTYGRTGSLWEGRFRSCLVDAEPYLLACHRYIELNPVRAGMVGHPGEYGWSSYGVNAQSKADRLLTPHPLYVALGSSSHARAAAYRELFRDALEPGLVDEIRGATNGGYCIGSERFRLEIEAMLGRRVTRGKPGRPKYGGANVSNQPDLKT